MKKCTSQGLILKKLSRIERKCDRIVVELTEIRRRKTQGIDNLIESMREEAVEMRQQSEREKEIVRRMLGL
jgi:hypothetical protein